MVEITLPNGRIREIEEADIPILLAMCRDKDIKRFYFMNQPVSLEQYWKQCTNPKNSNLRENFNPNRQDYYLPIEIDGIVKGLLTLYSKSRHSSTPDFSEKTFFEISYFIGREYRRQGIAELVVRRALAFAFEKLNASSVHAVCLIENEASRNLLKKLEFREVSDKNCKTHSPLSKFQAIYIALNPINQ
jgi:RimJ/RimL family protein N-acetyltransferase